MSRERAVTVLGYVIGFALLFLVWHLAATILVRSTLFPPPGPVLVRGWELIEDGLLQESVVASRGGEVRRAIRAGRVRIVDAVIGPRTGALDHHDRLDSQVGCRRPGADGTVALECEGPFDAPLRARSRWGAGFSLSRFHDALLRLGSPPLGLLPAALDQ